MTIDEQIPAIVVGMSSGELLPPHRFDISPSRVQAIMDYAAASGAIQCGSATNAYQHLCDLARFNQATTVEIFGAWEQVCVAEAVALALCKGIDVRVPKDLILSHPDFYRTSSVHTLSGRVNFFVDANACYTNQEDEKYWRFAPQRI